MSEWKECKLGDELELFYGKGLKESEREEGEYPVYGSNGIVGYHNNYLVKAPGIIIGRKGSVGELKFSIKDFFPIDTTYYVNLKHDNDIRFFYYFLLTLQLNEMNSHSAVPGLNRNDVYSIDVSIPPLPEQKAIASVLSSLDDKIDLLHRQNKTLEAMAETLFRQWFIEAKPQPSPNLSQRERNKIIEDESWEVKPLDEIANYLNGLACQKYPPQNDVDKLPVLKIKELRSGFSENSDWATSNVPDEYIIESGDVIFSWSGSLMVEIWHGEKCVLNQHLFKVTSDNYPKWFYYFWTKHHLDEFISIADSKSTTMGHIKRKDLSNSEVIIPDDIAFNKMDEVINPLLDKFMVNNNQIRTLEKLRDTLLPKLMSGEVRVK